MIIVVIALWKPSRTWTILYSIVVFCLLFTMFMLYGLVWVAQQCVFDSKLFTRWHSRTVVKAKQQNTKKFWKTKQNY